MLVGGVIISFLDIYQGTNDVIFVKLCNLTEQFVSVSSNASTKQSLTEQSENMLITCLIEESSRLGILISTFNHTNCPHTSHVSHMLGSVDTVEVKI